MSKNAAVYLLSFIAQLWRRDRLASHTNGIFKIYIAYDALPRTKSTQRKYSLS